MKTLSGLQGCWKLSVVRFLVLGGRTSLTVCFASSFAGALWAIAASENYAWGQVVKDNTLGSDSSLVTSPVPGTFQIDGGTTRGINLFHSFSQFSIPTLGIAYFNNALNIQNIISRVTGGSVSNIDGRIVADGTANLFLLNPNGIIFGPNASLSIGGSFIGSTASSLNFADGTQFSATAPQSTPLLTVSVPIGLQFGGSAGSILNQSQATNSNGEPVGLAVQPGKTLALVGGEVALSGGRLTTAGGRIELGSVAESGLVSLNPTDNGWTFRYDGVQNFQDIQLSQRAVVDASGEGGGDIQVQGRRVTLKDGSQIAAKTLGSEPGGILTVTASDSVEISGESANPQDFSRLTTRTEGTGNAGDLTINTGKLIVEAGAQVSTGTLPSSRGNGGTLTVNASDSIKASGASANGQVLSRLTTRTEGTGNAGNLTINTGKLIVEAGGQVSAGTLPSSRGDGGTLTVNALDSVQVSGGSALGTSPNGEHLSRLTTRTEGTGDAGDLTITTGKLVIENGAQVSAGTNARNTGDGGTLTVNASDSVRVSGVSPDGIDISRLTARTEGGGDARNLTITTRKLLIENGAQVSAGTFGEGQGGTLTVTASDSVQVSGFVIEPEGEKIVSRLATRTQGAGDARALTITTRSLIVRDEAQVDVRSLSSGKAGNLEITAHSIQLDNRGKLTAETMSGDGGNIILQDLDLLLMRRNSQISTTAGTAQAGGNGGNIEIDTDFIVAVPQENSDIIANAFTGRGGNINITAQGIYGIESRPKVTPLSDITASSQFGINGVVTINTPDVDPNRGLVNFPVEPVSVEVAQGCQVSGKQSSVAFFNTGRGGLAPNPYEPLSSSDIWENVPPPTHRSENAAGATNASASPATPPDKIVEAQGWLVNEKGEVVLVAQMPTTHSQGRCRLH